MEPTLILKAHGDSQDPGSVIVVNRNPFRVGRRPDNHFQLHRLDVSGNHAEFSFDGCNWWLKDLGSTNGTFVGGTRIAEPTRLFPGDLVHFGGNGYRVSADRTPDSGFYRTKVISDPDGRIRPTVDLHRVVHGALQYPVFQPIFRLADQTVFGWEALGRAAPPHEADTGLLFFLAEKSNQATALSEAFRRSSLGCVECQHCWPRDEGSYLFFNVNASEIVAPGFFNAVALLVSGEVWRRYQIVLEIPESLVCNPADMKLWLRQIRDLGWLAAYDDFGRGQSRLPDLINAPPDFLKLDRELVDGLGTNPVKRDLVGAIVEACGSLTVRTIAEGIETDEELAACLGMGIEFGQGYHFARPSRAYDLFAADSATLPEACPFVRLGIVAGP